MLKDDQFLNAVAQAARHDLAWSFHLDAAAWLAPWRLQGRTLKDNRFPLVNPLLGEFWKFGSLGWAGVNNSSWFLGLAFLAARL